MSHGGRHGSKGRGEKPDHFYRTTKRLFSYLKAYKFRFFFAIVLIAVQSLAGVAGNAMLRPIVDGLVDGLGTTYLLRQLLVLAVLYIVALAASYTSARFLVYVGEHAVFRIRKELFEHTQTLPVRYFDTNSHGTLMSAYTNDADMVTQALEDVLPNVLTAGLTFIGTLVMMIVLSPLLTLVVVGMLLVMLLVTFLVGRISSKNYKQRQHDIGEINGFVEEQISGQRVVKVFNMEERSNVRFFGLNEKMRRSATLAGALGIVMFPLMGGLSMIQYALTAMFGSYLVIAGYGGMTIGMLATFLQYTRNFSRPIVTVSQQTGTLIAAVAGAERIFRALDEPSEIDEGKIRHDNCFENDGKGCWLVPDGDTVRREPVRGEIIFENVTFAYVPGTNVLEDVSFYARPNQRVALVGSTGAGKTTIIQLLTRFYEIDSGRILLDGCDIRDIEKKSLREITGIVLQDVKLFSGTIGENIAYGKKDADREAVENAAKISSADHFITSLEDGYDSALTAEGENVSQGQRQLISIARAAIAEPVLLILDEATSSVDTRTERMIQKAMDNMMENRTTLAIAHRLSTVRNANVILVLEKGRIVERGDHDELMAAKGRYYELNVGISELT